MNQAKQSKAKRMTTGLTTVTKPGARLDDETRRFAAEEKARARGLFLDRRQRQLQVGGALLQWRSPSLRYGCCRHSVKIKNFYSFLPFSNTKKKKKGNRNIASSTGLETKIFRAANNEPTKPTHNKFFSNLMNVNHRAENGEKEKKKGLSLKCLNSFFIPRILKSDQNPALYITLALIYIFTALTMRRREAAIVIVVFYYIDYI